MQDETPFASRLPLDALQHQLDHLRAAIQQVIVGQDRMIDQLMVSLLSEGHLLLEGVPGVAKTLTAKLLAAHLGLPFGRIQFTPDLMPSDILGTSMFDMKKGEFVFKEGPIFTQMLVVDEINRAPAKTQSALFEVMEERQVTIDGVTYPMHRPFMVVATQNPVEHEGTYRLPEAQLDRFLFKVIIDYPTPEQEFQILERSQAGQLQPDFNRLQAALSAETLQQCQQWVQAVFVEPRLLQYMADIVVATRNHPFISLGASPRASLALLKAAKGFAAMQGRDFVSPEDVREAVIPVLNHRIAVTPEREMEGISPADIIAQIVQHIEVPR